MRLTVKTCCRAGLREVQEADDGSMRCRVKSAISTLSSPTWNLPPHIAGLDLLRRCAPIPKRAHLPVLMCRGIEARQIVYAAPCWCSRGYVNQAIYRPDPGEKLAKILQSRALQRTDVRMPTQNVTGPCMEDSRTHAILAAYVG